MTEEKSQVAVEINSLDIESDNKDSKKPFSKWRYFFLNVEANPDNDTIFDGEEYTIDTLLEFENDQRLDKANAPRWKKIVGFIWDPIFLPPAERKYMLKVDFFIFFYAILACFIKYLDQTSVNNAYVSGMKEDLNMYGTNDYNLLTTYFNIGYLSFSILMATTIKYVRPSIILPTCEIIWTIVVMVQAGAKTKETIFGLRVVQGALEASSFPGLTMLIGEYYDVESLAKKMFMMNATSSIASMFSGYIQAGAYTNLNGKSGLAGWRWVFLVDGFISIPISIIGFFTIPDFPQNTKAPWMTKKDRQFALARAKRHQRVKPRPMTVKSFLNAYKNWKLWVFLGPYAIGVVGSNHTSYFALYLKSLGKYTVQQINLIPTAQNGWSFVSMFIFGAFSDYYENRIIPISILLCFGMLSTIILSVWDVPFGLKIFAFIFGAGSSSQTLTISWFAQTYYDEPDLKAINIGTGNTIVYAFNAFLPLAIYKTSESPHFKYGYKISFMFYALGLICAWIFWYTAKVHSRNREARKLAAASALESETEEETHSIESTREVVHQKKE